MFDQKFAIDGFLGATNLKHSKEVQNLIDALEQLRFAVSEAPDWDGVFDPATVIDTVKEHVRWELTESTEALTKARNQAENKIYSQLGFELGQNLDGYVTQLKPAFNRASKAYAEAVTKLPREFNGDDLANFTAEEFQAYGEAKQALSEIESVMSWLQSVGQAISIHKYKMDGYAPEFLIIDPNDLQGFFNIQVSERRGWDNAYKAINPVLAKAVQDGATLRIALPAEARTMITEFEQQRTALNATAERDARTVANAW